MDSDLKQQINLSDELKAELDDLRPFPQGSLRSLQDLIALEWTFHSNAIEGNTLTLRETKIVLEGIAVGGKTMTEHFEAINHSHAIEYVGEIASNQEPFSEWQIKSLHSLILKNIDDDHAGRYRNEGVVISGASFKPPEPLLLPEEMENLVKWYEASQSDHPVLVAAELHTRFVKIHPFIDGNGRTARLLMNLELLKKGHLPAVIRKDDRLRYYDSLDEACITGDFTKIQSMAAEATCRSSLTYLSILKPGKYRD
jgi:Fic family protein